MMIRDVCRSVLSLLQGVCTSSRRPAVAGGARAQECAVKRLLRVLPSSRSFTVHADGSISVSPCAEWCRWCLGVTCHRRVQRPGLCAAKSEGVNSHIHPVAGFFFPIASVTISPHDVISPYQTVSGPYHDVPYGRRDTEGKSDPCPPQWIWFTGLTPSA